MNFVTVSYRSELCAGEQLDITIRLHDVSFPISETGEHSHIILQRNCGQFRSFGGLGRLGSPFRLLILRVSSHLHLKRDLSSLQHLLRKFCVMIRESRNDSRVPTQEILCTEAISVELDSINAELLSIGTTIMHDFPH